MELNKVDWIFVYGTLKPNMTDVDFNKLVYNDWFKPKFWKAILK